MLLFIIIRIQIILVLSWRSLFSALVGHVGHHHAHDGYGYHLTDESLVVHTFYI